MRDTNNLSESECITNMEGMRVQAKCLFRVCYSVCACMCQCVGEEFLSGAAVAVWLGTSLLQEQAFWKAMRSGPFSLLEALN